MEHPAAEARRERLPSPGVVSREPKVLQTATGADLRATIAHLEARVIELEAEIKKAISSVAKLSHDKQRLTVLMEQKFEGHTLVGHSVPVTALEKVNVFVTK
ncbi:hypothetical protein R1flu_001581 [Riccia fluitans]|uniref:Uncharacterized protein n=1 Tax=Riccia fluitans TaxID=41844 RepID=A0ABD1Y410_9MARC